MKQLNFCPNCGAMLVKNEKGLVCLYCNEVYQDDTKNEEEITNTNSQEESFGGILGSLLYDAKHYKRDGKKVTFGRWIQNLTYEETPIEWDIIAEKDGHALLLSRKVLDLADYDKNDEFANSMGTSIKSKNYKDSGIRQYLNGYFYDTAFNEYEKKIIPKARINNDKESVCNSANLNFCEKTEDYVYLLSTKEVNEILKDPNLRIAYGTELLQNDKQIWWLRSIYGDNNGFGYGVVTAEGKLQYFTEDSLISKGKTTTGKEEYFKANFGIRPACWIKL